MHRIWYGPSVGYCELRVTSVPSSTINTISPMWYVCAVLLGLSQALDLTALCFLLFFILSQSAVTCCCIIISQPNTNSPGIILIVVWMVEQSVHVVSLQDVWTSCCQVLCLNNTMRSWSPMVRCIRSKIALSVGFSQFLVVVWCCNLSIFFETQSPWIPFLLQIIMVTNHEIVAHANRHNNLVYHMQEFRSIMRGTLAREIWLGRKPLSLGTLLLLSCHPGKIEQKFNSVFKDLFVQKGLWLVKE